MGDGLHYGGGDTALLTIGRTTGKLSYNPCYLVCANSLIGVARSERFERSLTEVRSLPHYPDYANRVCNKLTDKVFSSDRPLGYGMGT